MKNEQYFTPMYKAWSKYCCSRLKIRRRGIVPRWMTVPHTLYFERLLLYEFFQK